MNTQDIAEMLIARTIDVISEDGLDKTTTKAIVGDTGINEVYIYRCFKNKDGLLAATFGKLDDELFCSLMQHIDIMSMQGMDFEMRCRFYFFSIWSFLLGNRNKCITYVRYLYSTYFIKYSFMPHKERYQPFLQKIKGAFKEEADVWMILNHILNVMLDFAVKVHYQQMPESDNYSEHVFRVIYASVKQYFKNQESEIKDEI